MMSRSESDLARLRTAPLDNPRIPMTMTGRSIPMDHLCSRVENLTSRELRQVSEVELEALDLNAPPSSSTRPVKSPLPSPSKRKLTFDEDEPTPFSLIPAANMSQSNFEDSGVWMTRNAKKQLAQITAGGQDEPARLPSSSSKGNVLPRDTARKNPNAYGGAGVGVSGGLDHSGKDHEEANSGIGLHDSDSSEDGDSTSSVDHDDTDSHDKEYSATTKGEHTSKAKSVLRAQANKEEAKVDTLYEDWVTKKDRILELINSPGYSSLPDTRSQISEASDPVRRLLKNIPEGYNVSRDLGLYTFAPTLEVYRNFSRFLAVVEEIAGRENGVVKIIVPKDSLPASKTLRGASTPANTSSGLLEHTERSITSNAGSSRPQTSHPGSLLDSDAHMTGIDPLPTQSAPSQPSPTLNASSFTMRLHENIQSDIWPVYKIKSESAGTVSSKDWRETIEKQRQFIAQGCNYNEYYTNDAWKAGRWETMNAVQEKAMFESFESGTEERLYAVDNDASVELREALGCHDLALDKLPGNSLTKSKSRIAGIHTPYFYVSNSQCTPFAIHIEDYAAYSVNYLHVGAPKCWRVIYPKHHRQVEEFLYQHINPPERRLSTSSGRMPRRPPQCTQFLRHHAMYLPKYTMDMLRIDYTTVIQHQGEMVVTFPFAYHEGWNTGPNIAEAVGYASDRWEIFMREGLYQNCHKLNCRQMPLNMDFGFLRAPVGSHKKARTQQSGTSRKKAASKALPATTDVSATGNAYASKLLQPASLSITPLQTPTPAPSGRSSIDPSSTDLHSTHAQHHAQRK